MELTNTYEQLINSKVDLKNIKVVVGLSGGVDSGITAYMLKKAGFNVVGVYMNNFESKREDCRSKIDRADAIKVASFLDIPIQVWDFRKQYDKLIISYFINSYKKGTTPNPDIYCNRYIKFDLFLKKAIKENADYIATGHYAQIFNGKQFKHPIIASPKDIKKDQSYFLCNINKKALNKTLFPLGQTTKTQNRKLAKNIKLPVADKKDSAGVCFLHGIEPKEFLKTKISEKRGLIVNKNADIVGFHKGVWFYTVGQRHGFSITSYTGKPSYIIEKKLSENKLVVGEKKDLLKTKIVVKNLKINISKKGFNEFLEDKKLHLRIRNLGDFIPIRGINYKKNSTVITLKKPFSSVAPGQFAVIYFLFNTKKMVIGYGEII